MDWSCVGSPLGKKTLALSAPPLLLSGDLEITSRLSSLFLSFFSFHSRSQCPRTTSPVFPSSLLLCPSFWLYSSSCSSCSPVPPPQPRPPFLVVILILSSSVSQIGLVPPCRLLPNGYMPPRETRRLVPPRETRRLVPPQQYSHTNSRVQRRERAECNARRHFLQ